MYAVILLTMLAFVPENLKPWYASCSEGDWGAAADIAESIYIADSTDTEALAAMVMASTLMYELDASVNYTPVTSGSDSLSSLSRTALGVLLMSGSHSLMESAENQLLKSIRLESDNVIAWYLMGILKVESDSTESALNCLNESISLDPDFLPARLEISRILRDNEKYDEALDGFRSIMTADSPSGIFALAEYILLMERTAETTELDSLENELIQSDPSVWIHIAEEQISRRPDIALPAAEKAFAAADSAQFSTDMARVFLQLEEYGRAILISKKLLESSPFNNAEILETLGTAYFEDHEINKAEETFLSLLEVDPMSLHALVCLGDIAEQKVRTEEAVNYYLRVLELDTRNVEVRDRLKLIAGDSYDPEATGGSSKGFTVSTAADLSIERGNRAFLEWGGSTSVSCQFDHRGTSIDAAFGGRSVTWEENHDLRKDTLNASRGWASLGFDYWFSDNYFVETASSWDRQMYTERPWQISSYAAIGWQKWMLSWLWFSPKIGIGYVNARWTSSAGEAYVNDFSVYTEASLWYGKPHTFIREAEISGNVFFPPDNPENFISRGSVSLAFRTWSPLYLSIGYNVDYTRTPEISTWKKFNTSFTTSINFDLI